MPRQHPAKRAIPHMDAPLRAPTPEIRFERVVDLANRLVVADLCPHPSCGAPSPLHIPPRAPFGRGLRSADLGGWSTVPSRTYNALYTAPQSLTQPCRHWQGVASTPDEVRALLPQGGVARARHATDAQGRDRGEGVDSRWRCWRLDDNGHERHAAAHGYQPYSLARPRPSP